MKALYFDCFSGISGDMTLGALLDLGADGDALRSELEKLKLSGYELIIQKVKKNGIIGTDVKISIHESLDTDHDINHVNRSLNDIESLIDRSDLKQQVKDFSKRVFREIAAAEAKVHDMPVEKVHFHEVGALDSIIDIVGVAICLDLLGIKKVFSSPLHDGRGFTRCNHGIIPVPVPAVVEMLKGSGIPFVIDDIAFELVTPTGMGLIKTLASGFGTMPAMIIDRIGYGMGKHDTGRFNALRVVMGSLFGETGMLEEVAVLETSIDDMSPEIAGFTVDKLIRKGALDAFITPIIMKKGRPAVMLTVLCANEMKPDMLDILFKETTTLGVRERIDRRYCMQRKVVSVDTAYGQARVKAALMDGFVKWSPEYEDCREIAERTGKSLKEIYEIVDMGARTLLRNGGKKDEGNGSDN